MKTKSIQNIFPTIQVARFNLAVWHNNQNNSLCFIGREVAVAGNAGEPDNGILKLIEVDQKGAVTQEKVIWQPLYDGINLEDPRALQLSNEHLVIGLTAVLRDKKGYPIPFPALVKIDSFSSWSKYLPPFLIIDSFGPGKNLTPIDPNTFLFRPDAKDYFHKLIAFSLHSQVPEKLGDISFPTDLPWATWRIGTTMPPLWLTPNDALFIIHGITKQIIDGIEKYVYSIGRAKLIRNGNSFQVIVAEQPILTPDDFLDASGKPLVEELHPELRRVLYCCGGVIKKKNPDKLSLFVNVGDRKTYEVEFSLQELKEGLF